MIDLNDWSCILCTKRNNGSGTNKEIKTELEKRVDFHFVVNFKIRKMPRPSTNIFRKYFGFNLETNKSVCQIEENGKACGKEVEVSNWNHEIQQTFQLHTLQLVILGVLNDNAVKKHVLVARRIVKKLRTPTFRALMLERKLPKPPIDCVTRWVLLLKWLKL